MDKGYLFSLLPQVHRARDIAQGHPLEALFTALESQSLALHANIGTLYDNWFIETCQPWLVPYLGDLVALDPVLAGLDLPGLRTLVANLTDYRSRRGTLACLGHAATAISGWTCMAVDLDNFRSGTWAPGMQQTGTWRVQARGGDPAAGLVAARSVDLRRGAPVPGTGTPGLPGGVPGTLGLLAWPLRPVRLYGVEARPVPEVPGAFHLNPLGIAAPLHVPPARLPVAGAAAGMADLPLPLTRAWLADWLADPVGRTLPDPPVALRLRYGDSVLPVPVDRIVPADLSVWPDRPVADDGLDVRVMLDPERGRLLVVGAAPDRVFSDHALAMGMDLGGGGYGRAGRLPPRREDAWIVRVGVTGDAAFPDLASALAAWPAQSDTARIVITDSAIHRLPGTGAGLRLAGRSLTIVAADGCRPCLSGAWRVSAGPLPGELGLSGLLLDGPLTLVGPVDLTLADCTLMPTTGPALIVDASPARRRLTASHSILGPMVLPARGVVGLLRECVLDGRGGPALCGPSGPADRGPALALDGCTALGPLRSVHPCDLRECLVLDRPDGRSPLRSRRLGDPAYAMPFFPVADGKSAVLQRGAHRYLRLAGKLDGIGRVLENFLPEGRSCQIMLMI